MLVALVQVAARRVGLPDLNEGISQWPSIFVQHLTADDDAFAERVAGMLVREVAGLHINRGCCEGRPGDFRKCLRQINERFRGGALDGGSICRMEISGLRLRIRPAVCSNLGHATTLLAANEAPIRASFRNDTKAEKPPHRL